MTSVFCRATWEQFCRQEREPPIHLRCGQAHGTVGLEVDLRGCQRNCLRFPGFGWSVFAPTDSIRPAVAGQLAEWSWVERTVRERFA